MKRPAVSLLPKVTVIGVAAKNASVPYQSVLAGRLIETREETTIAGALSGGIGKENRYTLAMVADLLDAAVTVTESMIRFSMAALFANFHLIVEGGGAITPAAMLAEGVLGKDSIGPSPVAIVTGGNIELSLLESIVDEWGSMRSCAILLAALSGATPSRSAVSKT